MKLWSPTFGRSGSGYVHVAGLVLVVLVVHRFVECLDTLAGLGGEVIQCCWSRCIGQAVLAGLFLLACSTFISSIGCLPGYAAQDCGQVVVHSIQVYIVAVRVRV